MTDTNSIDVVTERFLSELHAGSDPSIEDYVREFPQISSEIRELFPTLLRLERLAPALLSQRGSKIDLQPGKLIHHYRLIKIIGRGGMAEVFEAEDTRIGRKVALKLIRLQDTQASYQRRFEAEAVVVGQFHHTNIVPVFDTGSDEAYGYIAMQLIDGCSLAELVDQLHLRPSAMGWASSLEQEPVSLEKQDETLARAADSTADLMMKSRIFDGSSTSLKHYYINVARIGSQIADALDYSHRHQVLHRDIKPGNVLLDAQCAAWVTDFGLAKTNEDLTRTGDLVGTISYMAPERFEGRGDERSDVYSVGATLYCLLCGRPPSNLQQANQTDRSNSSLVRRSYPAGVPNDLKAVVEKSIANQPDLRYRSAADLREDLERFCNGELVLARRTSWTRQFSRWLKTNPALATVSIMLVLLLAVVATVATLVAAELKHREDQLITASIELKQERDQLQQTTDRLTKSNQLLNLQVTQERSQSYVESWTEAIEISPESFLPYLKRGQIHLNHTHDFDTALRDYSKATEILEKMSVEELNKQVAWGHFHEARLGTADLLVLGNPKTRDYHRAIELSEALLQYDRDWYILNTIGFAHYRLGQYEQADKILEEASEFLGDSQNPRILYYSAMAKWQLGKHEEARQQLARAETVESYYTEASHPFTTTARNEAKQMIGGPTPKLEEP